MELCIIKGCYRKHWSRGLCKACYESARRAVLRKKTTFEMLEARGLMLPPFAVRTANTPFNRALEASCSR